MASAPESISYGFGYVPTPRETYTKFSGVLTAKMPVQCPPKVDLSATMTSIKDQGQHGSCVGFSVCAALDALHRPGPGELENNQSERFIWYNSKSADGLGNPNADRGTYIHSALAAAQKLGSCWEETCPYEPALAVPDRGAYDEGLKMKVTRAHTVPSNVDDLRTVLAGGHPVVVGFEIFGDLAYQSQYIFGDVRKTGIMKMPPAPIPPVTAGHAVLFVGYDDSTRLFKFKNSWSAQNGDKGYYYMPYDYIQWTNDAWVVDTQDIIPHPNKNRASSAGITLQEGEVGAVSNLVTEEEDRGCERCELVVSDGLQPCDVVEF